MNETLEDRKCRSAAFWDKSQGIDKIRKSLPLNYFLILRSYLENRHFLVQYQDEQSILYPIEASVPQASVLEPMLFFLNTPDLPQSAISLQLHTHTTLTRFQMLPHTNCR
ncbi:hypothetical protein JTB14_013233 [Gonioctena quinquepunctata]|nr:hypothetical protein JTB14_013233 [Gonioctena quinquepunctata]